MAMGLNTYSDTAKREDIEIPTGGLTCANCGQVYFQNSKEIFSRVTKASPHCPHCYKAWNKHPKVWKRKIKELRKAIEENLHKEHNAEPSKYHEGHAWCFTCHTLFKIPEKLPYTHTSSPAGGAGGAGWSSLGTYSAPIMTTSSYPHPYSTAYPYGVSSTYDET